MASAEVGDDVYGEDPTINALEAEVAELFGHGAALFVPSGTMGNLVALRLLCAPGDELLCDADAHIVSYEAGAAAAHGGIQTRTMVVPRGLLTPDVLEPAAPLGGLPRRADAAQWRSSRPTTAAGERSIRCRCSTTCGLLLTSTRSLCTATARGSGTPTSPTGVALADYGALFDTMSVCLSKGLGAPVGSLVVMKDASRYERARALRHQLGGAMRQAGVLAAAGLYALRHHLERLADDHARATRLAEGIAEVAPSVVEPQVVETNIVILDLADSGLDAARLDAVCRAEGVLVSCVAPHGCASSRTSTSTTRAPTAPST